MAQRVSFEERCRIEALAGEGSWSVAEIAVHVGRSEPTIRREFARCGGRGFYAAADPQAGGRSRTGPGGDRVVGMAVVSSRHWGLSSVRSHRTGVCPRRRSIRPVMTVWRLGVFGRVPGSCCPAGVPAADPVAAVNRPDATSSVTSEG